MLVGEDGQMGPGVGSGELTGPRPAAAVTTPQQADFRRDTCHGGCHTRTTAGSPPAPRGVALLSYSDTVNVLALCSGRERSVSVSHGAALVACP